MLMVVKEVCWHEQNDKKTQTRSWLKGKMVSYRNEDAVLDECSI